MSEPERKSGLRPVGEAEVVAQNPWFSTVRQPMDFVDPRTGLVKKSAADGGAMNYVDIGSPGVLVVANIEGQGAVLVAQERHTTNLVEGKTVAHYELPGGGIDKKHPEEDEIIAAAHAELRQEAGMKAGKIILIGSRHRGIMAHPSITDHNYTALAFDVETVQEGPTHDDSEVIVGAGEVFSWYQTSEMALNPDGLWFPAVNEYRCISAGPTIAALSLAQTYLARNPIDL